MFLMRDLPVAGAFSVDAHGYLPQPFAAHDSVGLVGHSISSALAYCSIVGATEDYGLGTEAAEQELYVFDVFDRDGFESDLETAADGTEV